MCADMTGPLCVPDIASRRSVELVSIEGQGNWAPPF